MWAYNCSQCQKSCEKEIGWLKSFVKPESCRDRFCACPPDFHRYENFEWTTQEESIEICLKEKMEEYELNAGCKMSVQEMLQRSQAEQRDIQQKILSLLSNVTANAKSLENSSLKSNKSTASDYLQLMKNRTVLEKRSGYSSRIQTLEDLLKIIDEIQPNQKKNKSCQTNSFRYD